MKRYKKIVAACSLTIGMGAGAVLFSPTGKDAASNVVLASVDWVNSIVNPINSRVTTLESKVTSLQATVNSLQAEVDSLKASNGNGSGGTTSPTPAPAPPANPSLPSVVYVSKASAAIHSGATNSYTVIATKSKGSALTVIDSFTGAAGLWYRVSLSSTVKGWIYSGDVSTTKVAVTNPTQVVTTGVVNLRKGATTDYPVVETIQKGVTLKYISKFVNNAGETWYNVQSPAGNKGWISSNLGEVN